MPKLLQCLYQHKCVYFNLLPTTGITPVFSNMYPSRYPSICILQYVSILIHHSLYSSKHQIQIQHKMYPQVGINPDTPLFMLK